MKTYKRLILVSLFCLSFILFPFISQAVNVESVPNPRAEYGGWVTDMADILSADTESQLNTMIGELEAENGAEIAVVTVPDTEPYSSPKDFTTRLFNHWGIGKAEEDNGILFMISEGDRRVEIETGYGMEAILPDAKVGNILDTHILPHFKNNDFDTGALAGTEALINVVTNKGDTVVSQNNHQGLAIPKQYKPGILLLVFGSVMTALLCQSRIKGKLDHHLILEPGARSRIYGMTEPDFQEVAIPVYLASVTTLFAVSLFLVLRTPLAYIGLIVVDSLIILFWTRQYLRGENIKFFDFTQTWKKIIKSIGFSLLLLIGFSPLILLVLGLIPPLFKAVGSIIAALFLGLGALLFSNAATSIAILTTGGSSIVTGYFIANWIIKRLRVQRFRIDPHTPMQSLDSQTLMNHLTEAEKVAYRLGSVRYEGWQDKQKAIHIRGYLINKEDFIACPHCEEYTATKRTKLLKQPSHTATGQQEIKRKCHCCNYSKYEFVEIPAIPVVSRRSSSGSSSTGYSGGSYSSGSYSGGSSGGSSSGGGSSFGGGDSGGGGAGGSF